jgi:K(+)-stimulated pyrophosphate-energized sodium pump
MGHETGCWDGKMKEISDHIYEGALAFLKAEYKLLAIFVVGKYTSLYSFYRGSYHALDDFVALLWALFSPMQKH